MNANINEHHNNLSLQQKRFYSAAIDIAQNDPDELGFVCRSMVFASIPHAKVRGLQYKRKNSNFTLTNSWERRSWRNTLWCLSKINFVLVNW